MCMSLATIMHKVMLHCWAPLLSLNSVSCMHRCRLLSNTGLLSTNLVTHLNCPVTITSEYGFDALYLSCSRLITRLRHKGYCTGTPAVGRFSSGYLVFDYHPAW